MKRSCRDCKHQENCGVLRPHRFSTKRDRSKFITSSSEECKDWERQDENTADAK